MKSYFISINIIYIQADLEAWLHHLAAQHAIDEGAKDPQTNKHFRAFLIDGANQPPFDASLEADSKSGSSSSNRLDGNGSKGEKKGTYKSEPPSRVRSDIF
jgi:hypothetical protein